MRLAWQEKYINTSNGKIFYFATPYLPNRPTIIFLHGLSANHTTWDTVADILSSQGFNCLAPDLRGHGLSDKTKKQALYQIPTFTADLQQILNEEEIDRCILVGYSFGGALAIDFAAQYPDLTTGLVLISANHANPLEYNGLGWLTPLALAALKFLTLIFAWQKRKNYLYYHPDGVGGYWRSTWEGLQTMPWSVNGWLVMMMAKLNLREEIKRINKPVIIVHSKHDPFLTDTEIQEMTTALPQATVILSKNPSHFIATRAQDEIARIILEFLNTDL